MSVCLVGVYFFAFIHVNAVKASDISQCALLFAWNITLILLFSWLTKKAKRNITQRSLYMPCGAIIYISDSVQAINHILTWNMWANCSNKEDEKYKFVCSRFQRLKLFKVNANSILYKGSKLHLTTNINQSNILSVFTFIITPVLLACKPYLTYFAFLSTNTTFIGTVRTVDDWLPVGRLASCFGASDSEMTADGSHPIKKE